MPTQSVVILNTVRYHLSKFERKVICAEEICIPTCIRKALVLLLEIVTAFGFFLKIYTLSTYADVVTLLYAKHKYDMFIVARGFEYFCIDLNIVGT